LIVGPAERLPRLGLWMELAEVGRGGSEGTCKRFRSEAYSHKILQNLHDLWTAESFTDVEIECDGERFQVHRAVLASSSTYFRAMFTVGMKESRSRDTVLLHNIPSSVFSTILDFIYTGQIFLTQTNVQEILIAADLFELREVIESCTDFLKSQLHPTNAIGIFRFAETHSVQALKSYAQAHIFRNFPQVVEEEEFLETPKDILLQFFESEKLKVDSEYQVLQAALRWLMYDISWRKPYVFEVLRTVRLALISSRLLEQCTNEVSDCSIQLALRSLQRDLRSKRGSLVSLLTQPRKSAKKHIYVIGGSHKELGTGWKQISESTLDSVQVFDTFQKTWNRASSMEIERILPGVASLEGLIYVVGGEQESKILANGEVYSPQEDLWSFIEPMIIPRCAFGLTSWENELTNESFLFAFGGWVGEDIGGSIERYDPYSNEWTLLGDMEEPRFSMGCFSYNGLIYLLGGCTHTQRHLKNLSSFNPITTEWTQLAPMKVSRSQMGIAILNNCLYVMGGSSRHSEVLKSVEKYSFEKNEWVEICPLNVGRANASSQAVDGKIYCIGGDQTHENNFFRAQVTLSTVETYDPLTDSWEECVNLPESRSEAGSVVV